MNCNQEGTGPEQMPIADAKTVCRTTLSKRLRELSLAASECRWREFSMRVPADTDRDADLVLSRAADEIDRLTAENAALREERDALAATLQKARSIVGVMSSGLAREVCLECDSHDHAAILAARDARVRADERERIAAADAEAVPNAEFCPHCSPCRNSERLAKAERLNIEYDAVLRNLASYLGAGGFGSLRLIDPKVADEKIRWGIDNVVGIERNRAAAADAEAVPVGVYLVTEYHGMQNTEFQPLVDFSVGQHTLYARPQHADVGVLVEALNLISRGECYPWASFAREAIETWEAKR